MQNPLALPVSEALKDPTPRQFVEGGQVVLINGNFFPSTPWPLVPKDDRADPYFLKSRAQNKGGQKVS